MEVLRGKPVAERIDSELRRWATDLGKPVLAVYLVGADRSSEIYARSKVRKGEMVGVDVLLRKFPADSDQDTIARSIREDSSNERISGMMIERPLPDPIDLDQLMEMIPPEKDVEGLHPCNYGAMAFGKPRFVPPTPLGALFLMDHYGIMTEGKRIAVIGRSPNVGRPLATMLSQKRDWGNATVTLLHSRTSDASSHISKADIVITAVGSPGMLKGHMIKEGAKLIDLGINPSGDTIVGDVDIDSVSGKASAATPTPGGTGPVTVSAMFLNVFRARMLQKGSGSRFKDDIIKRIYP
ncbi:MAG: bifunctional 5,10-methylenetetrahydrofolate dehydrogenase/5,10-methenyltetrahydrofolate cyclohydrolase [Thermoplasmatota archaeon]